MVGRHEALNADQARQWSTFIIMRIREGDNLAPLPLAARFNGGPTVSDLAERCLEPVAPGRGPAGHS